MDSVHFLLVIGQLVHIVFTNSGGYFKDANGFITLDDGVHVKTLGSDCKMEKFRIGPKSAMMLESANLHTEYEDGLKCKNIFVPNGDCSLLLQCEDFELQPQNKNGKCGADFLLVKDKQHRNKYCGSDQTLINSINHGDRMEILFKTNKNKNDYKGFKCHISCCPQNHLSNTQVQLDFR